MPGTNTADWDFVEFGEQCRRAYDYFGNLTLLKQGCLDAHPSDVGLCMCSPYREAKLDITQDSMAFHKVMYWLIQHTYLGQYSIPHVTSTISALCSLPFLETPSMVVYFVYEGYQMDGNLGESDPTQYTEGGQGYKVQ